MVDADFSFASERLELAVSTVAGIAKGFPAGPTSPVFFDYAFTSLRVIQFDDERHGSIIFHELDKLANISEGRLTWNHGRGLSGLLKHPVNVFPHVWLSGHQAALDYMRLALQFWFLPLELGPATDDAGKLLANTFGELPTEQQALFRKLLSKQRRKSLSMTIEEVADMQGRIRHERVKLLTPGEIGWSEAKAPAQWCRDLSISSTTMRRYEKAGSLVVDKLTIKLWRIRLDTLKRYQGEE